LQRFRGFDTARDIFDADLLALMERREENLAACHQQHAIDAYKRVPLDKERTRLEPSSVMRLHSS
jgi:hypothetical protein